MLFDRRILDVELNGDYGSLYTGESLSETFQIDHLLQKLLLVLNTVRSASLNTEMLMFSRPGPLWQNKVKAVQKGRDSSERLIFAGGRTLYIFKK